MMDDTRGGRDLPDGRGRPWRFRVATWAHPVKQHSPKPQRRDSAIGRVVRALESDGVHSFGIDRWIELLSTDDPDGYGDRPIPSAPTWVPAGPLRVSVYAQRARAGMHLFHPGDTRFIEGACDHIAIQAMKGRKQGGLRIEGVEEELDDDDELRLDIPDGRKRPRTPRPGNPRG